jgi:ADP-heptose:LPS heptosyltransferase
MRRIDSWVGNPLLKLLGWFTSQPRALFGEIEFKKLPERVVCTKFIGLGSVVLSLPLLKALKNEGVRIAFWSFEGQAELVRLLGCVDEIVVIRPTLFGFLPSLWKSWRQVRKFKPEAFLDLEPTANLSAILSRISGAKVRVGFIASKPNRESMFTHLVSLNSERHMVESNLWMGKRIGLPDTSDKTLPALPNLSKIKNVLPESRARRRIVVNINASDLSWHRMWQEDYWIELCNRLLGDYSVDLIFPGGEDERDRVQALIARLKDPTRVFNVAGTVSLVELLRLLHDAEVVVSVDSGIMHLSAWAGAPLVALFGPETPGLYGPQTSNAITISAGLPCSPCLSFALGKVTRCRDNQCMKKITPDMVYRACISVLRRDKRQSPASVEIRIA